MPTKLFEEWYVHNKLQRTEIARPSPSDISAAIGRMDGKQRTMILIDDGAGRLLTVGGGNEGNFVVEIAEHIDKNFLLLTRRDRSDDAEVKLVVGGQCAFYSLRHCCNEDEANSAAASFLDTGALPVHLFWKTR
jgi:hypothetical protein